jgi:peptidoglycan hydrolase-like protein with peptidoglycan-binding domain
MKLRILAVAAGFAMLPAIAGAQTPTDTTKKDTMTAPTAAPAPAPVTPMAAKDSSLEPKPVPPSDGTTCPWGCPTSAGAAGLTGPQFLALQQELRDRKCGLRHVTGRYDAATRSAVRRCATKLGVANNPRAVLVAMDVGYGSADIQASGEEE